MIAQMVWRSLVITVLAGFGLFWTYNLFGAQFMTEESGSHTAALSAREASAPPKPLTGQAKLILEILENADELGLRVNLPPVTQAPAAAKPQAPSALKSLLGKAMGGESTPVPAVVQPQTQTQPQTQPAAQLRKALTQGTADKTDPKPDYEQCLAAYGKATYLPKGRMRKPPMLYTFPGSGNTWARLLIDKASGILSGSVYNDRSLVPALPGELSCDWSVSVVKTHPHTHNAAALLNGGFHSDGNMKCTKGNIRSFEKAVLLIRDPYDSIWSEYQRRAQDSHVAGIPKNEFDMVEWLANAANLANRYREMWTKQYYLLEEKLPPENILYVRYEDLTNKDKRVEALRSIIAFIGFPEVSDERLRCAFALADSKHAKRTTDDSMIGKKDLYTDNRDLVCKMWATFGEHAAKHDYTPWRNYDCSGYDQKLLDMNVGPQGTINKGWMKNRKVDVFEMKKGVAPVGDSKEVSNLPGKGRPRADGGIRKTKKGPSSKAMRSGNVPDPGSLVGLGALGKDKPAWAD